MEKIASIPHFLADTWWFGLTGRLTDQQFKELATLRASQGFNAVNIVMGIPPEVGPKNANASSPVGPAWNMKGEFNPNYLNFARKRIKTLNETGLMAIVYGAWGHQIEWLGEHKMVSWWQEIINKTNDLDVLYSLTGESDIWINEEKKLLPDKTTDDMQTTQIMPYIHPRLLYIGKRLLNKIKAPVLNANRPGRQKKWSTVLEKVDALTNKPIIMHVVPGMTSEQAVNNPNLLDAITVQTGHDPNTKNLLWQIPKESLEKNPSKPFINLEPWYEGILGKFETDDQLYAYWVSMMSGSWAYTYGAHGIWNAGDGKFLSHWGKQTLSEAMNLKAPELIGKSHAMFIKEKMMQYSDIAWNTDGTNLRSIVRKNKYGKQIAYIPDIAQIDNCPKGQIYLPVEGHFSAELPKKGQVLIIN